MFFHQTTEHLNYDYELTYLDFMNFPDIQSKKMHNSFILTRVGVTEVKKPVHVHRPDKIVTLIPSINVYVNLPADQKGSHLSRHLEVINEIIDKSVRESIKSLESLCSKIVKLLLERHEYANYAEVEMMADYFLERVTPHNKKSLEVYKLLAKSTKKRGERLQKSIGVEVIGMTACPCAMETTKKLLGLENNKSEICDSPTITHNQRNISTLIVDVPEDYEIEADDLVEIVENSMSTATFEILKRDDEGEVVLNAHKNPKFVEDVVRDILKFVLEKYSYLPDETLVKAKSESEESIHKHNAFAERVTTLGELRR